MLVLLVVLPCLVLGAAAVVLLDRMGVLPRWESSASSGRSSGGSLLESVPRAALVAAMGLMAAWILAWLVFLVIGLNVLAS